ncbi:hypothetical protein Btru_040584 [Bulinus truncatus]|nr:hypothetical protein Btru_040584 [Bulinus truncatus]
MADTIELRFEHNEVGMADTIELRFEHNEVGMADTIELRFEHNEVGMADTIELSSKFKGVCAFLALIYYGINENTVESYPSSSDFTQSEKSATETSVSIYNTFSGGSSNSLERGMSSVGGLENGVNLTSVGDTDVVNSTTSTSTVESSYNNSKTATLNNSPLMDDKLPHTQVSNADNSTMDDKLPHTQVSNADNSTMVDKLPHTQVSNADNSTMDDKLPHTQVSNADNSTMVDKLPHTQVSNADNSTMVDKLPHTQVSNADNSTMVDKLPHTQDSNADNSTMSVESVALVEERSSYQTRRTNLLTTSTPQEMNASQKYDIDVSSFHPKSKYSCPFRCQNKKVKRVIETVEQEVLDMYCLYCKCDLNQCRLYDMCCLDITDPFIPFLLNSNESKVSSSVPNFATEDGTNFHSVERGLKLSCVDLTPDTVMVINSCPVHTRADGSQRELCESDLPVHQITAAALTYVIDSATNVTYKNIFCAQCNGAILPILSKLKVECYYPMFIYMATSVDEMIRWSMNPMAECTIGQVWEEEYDVFLCENNNIICAAAFPEISGLQYRLRLWLIPVNPQPYTSDGLIKTVTYHFRNNKMILGELGSALISFLLNFDASSYIPLKELKSHDLFQYSNCSLTEWSAPSGDCQPLHCSPGKLLINSSCAAAFPEIFGLQYRLRLWLIPVNPQPYTSDGLLKTVTQQLQTRLIKQKVDTFDLIHISAVHPTNDSLYSFITIDATLKGPIFESRDSFESLLLSDFINNRINMENKVFNLTFQPLQASSKTLTFRFCGEMRLNHVNIYCERYKLLSWHEQRDNRPNEPQPIEVSNLLFCAHVTFNQSYYELEYSGSDLQINFTVTVDLNVTKVTLSETSELNNLIIEDSGELKICQEILDRKLTEIQNGLIIMAEHENWEINNALSVLSLVCNGLSLLCLTLTVLTYGLHPVLRTAAGRNNLMLSLSLLTAQTSTLAASNIEVTGPPCTALSISTHFLWLWMFYWAFICGHHMYTVFTAKTRSAKPGNDVRNFVKLCALSALCPALIVTFVVTFSYFHSGGQSIGYGLLHCWFDSLLLTVFAFICPVLVVVICSIIFFIITVVKIHKVRQLNPSNSTRRRKQRQNFIVYVKLSAMTGIFWMLAVLAEVTGSVYFRFIAVPLYGLEGVYIFLSYVCNNRVLKLHLQKFS